MAKALTIRAILKIAHTVEVEAQKFLTDCIKKDRIPAEEHESCYWGGLETILESLSHPHDHETYAPRVLTRDEVTRIRAVLTAAGVKGV